MTILLPVVAILAVTGEWSQRAGLTTFTLVPHRGRVDPSAEAAVTLRVGIASMALVPGDRRRRQHRRHGARRASTRSGTCRPSAIAYIVGADLIGMTVGFMLGVSPATRRLRSWRYFTYWFVVPTLSMGAGRQPGVVREGPALGGLLEYPQNRMYDGGFSAQDWLQLAVTGAVWLVLPLAFGLWRRPPLRGGSSPHLPQRHRNRGP